MMQPELIKVDYITNQDAQSTIVRINQDSTAADVCVPLATKINISQGDLKYFSLVCVYVITFASGSKHHCIKTIKPKEKVIEIRSKLIDRQNCIFSREMKTSTKLNWFFKDSRSAPLISLANIHSGNINLGSNINNNNNNNNNISSSSYSSNNSSITQSSTNSNFSSSNIINNFNTITDGNKYKSKFSEAIAASCTIGGDSSSDDEEPISSGDLAYLLSFDRKSVMLKKSSKDPNLWKERTVILSDKFWCIDVMKSKALSIPLTENTRVIDEFPKLFNFKTVFAINRDSGGTVRKYIDPISDFQLNEEGTTYFCTESVTELNSWRDDLKYFQENNIDNDRLRLAQLLIEDQDGHYFNKSLERMKKSYDNILSTNVLLANIGSDSTCSTQSESNSTSNMSHLNIFDESERNCGKIRVHNNLYASCLCNYETFKSDNFSFFHSFHECRRSEAEMMSLLVAIYRYKDLQKMERVSPKRLWHAAVRIYHKYLFPQLTLILKRRSQKAIDIENSYNSDKNNIEGGNSSISMQSSLSNSVPKDFQLGDKSDTNQISDSSNNCESTLKCNISNSGNVQTTFNNKFGARLFNDSGGELFWGIPSEELLKIHGLIFKNIRKQVAGVQDFDGVLQSSESLVSDPNNDSSEGDFEGECRQAGTSAELTAGSNSPPVERPSFLGLGFNIWSWSDVRNNDSGLVSQSSKSKINSNWTGLTKYDLDPIISLYNDSVKDHNSTISADNTSNSYKKSSQFSPFYQILDIGSKPSADLFDVLISQIESQLDFFQKDYVLVMQRFKQAFMKSI